MREHLPILLEGLLFGGSALAFGLWQLHSIKRERARDAERARQARAAEDPPDPPRPPEGAA